MLGETVQTAVKIADGGGVCARWRDATLSLVETVCLFFNPASSTPIYRFHIDDFQLERRGPKQLRVVSDLKSVDVRFSEVADYEYWSATL